MSVYEYLERPMQRILLAEDDHSMRRFLVGALEKAGYTVAAFADGAQAFRRLQEEPFTLLLTDIVMPEMDGIELARRASSMPSISGITMSVSSSVNGSSCRRRKACAPSANAAT